MDLAMGAMGSLLYKLGEVINEEYKLQKRLRKRVNSFSTEVQIMQAALSKVAKVPRDQLDDQVKIWAADVRELSYDMEDVIDSLLVCDEMSYDMEDDQTIFKKILAKMANLFKKGKALHDISTAVEEIHARLQDIVARHQRYNILNLPAETMTRTSVDPLLEALYGDKKNIIGLEKARDEILQKISDPEAVDHPPSRKKIKIGGGEGVSKKQLKILSIVGFGGLGKTTLAREVYDALSTKFQYKAFVSVSRNPDMKKVLSNLLFKLDYKTYCSLNVNAANFDEEQLIILITEFLKNKRYFIIIDDLWKAEAWQRIRRALIDDNCGSIIITTTRQVLVSKLCSSSEDEMIHRMKRLSDNDSEQLFYRRIFSSEVCRSGFEQVSKDILKKCAGVPLAIISLASYLASNQEIKPISHWRDLLEAIGRGLINGDTHVEDMKRILSLSFYDLPPHLKTCFLYLSIFPEDHQINKARLIRRWISEGFIQAQGQTSLTEIGDNYFNELANRNLIQPIIHVYGWVEACCVHDIMLDLICELSGGENFVTILDLIKGDTPLEENFRRLSLQKSMTDLTTRQMATRSMQKVRSFTAFSPAISMIPPLSIFKVLRVLDLEGCNLGESLGVNLRQVENLLYLRYLGLRGTRVGKLPIEIGKLHFLQTLDLQHTNSKELPSSIVQLEHLMCLVLDLGMPLPERFFNLTCLEQLVGHGHGIFSADSAEELGHLTRLRELAFEWDSRNRVKPYFRSLDDLRTDKPMTEYMQQEYRTDKALIKILDNHLKTDKALIKSLGNLHKLESLEISSGSYWVNNLMQDWVPPPNLRSLKYDDCFKGLPPWIRSSSLPLLSYLDLKLQTVRSEDIPIIGMLPALRYVTVVMDTLMPHYVKEVVFKAHAFPCVRVCLFTKILLVHPEFQPGAMPMVQRLRFGLADDNIVSPDFDLSLPNLPSLQQLRIDLRDNGKYSKAEKVLRCLVDDHPRRPILRVDRYYTP